MSITNPFVSVIMPVYNGEMYIAEAIDSVINQIHKNWELLIINDGSTDKTEIIISTFLDQRILYLKQENKGVSSARNIGLTKMKGDYFCFLDSDDILPPNSISARLLIFKENLEISFADGYVQYVNEKLKPLSKIYKSNFKGKPFNNLLKLDPNCLFGNTWMIKRDKFIKYNFDVNLTHAEDLFFYLSISENKIYSYTNELVLLYRQTNNSAMKNIRGLERGYIILIKNIRNKLKINGWKIFYLKLKISKIMILSFAFDALDIFSAIKTPFKIFKA